jgi:hypothetical protein
VACRAEQEPDFNRRGSFVGVRGGPSTDYLRQDWVAQVSPRSEWWPLEGSGGRLVWILEESWKPRARPELGKVSLSSPSSPACIHFAVWTPLHSPRLQGPEPGSGQQGPAGRLEWRMG